MKVSNNALNFLLAQYRAIFKRAYVKGLASAVLLTATLAAGQAQAANTLNNDSGSVLASGGLEITIDGTGTAENHYDKLQLSGGLANSTWNADVKITSGSIATDNFIKGSGGALTISGNGSLTIDLAETVTTASGNGLKIFADGNDTSLTLSKVDIQRGEIQVVDKGSNGSGDTTLAAGIINIGSANASIRKTITPSSRISPTGVIRPIICGANQYIRIPINPMTHIPMNTVM